MTPLTVSVENNRFRGKKFDRNEVYPSATDPVFFVKQHDAATPLELHDNQFEDSELCNALPGTCNGTAAGFEGSGNVSGEIEPVRFHNAGLDPDFDYLTLERWTAKASLAGDAAVSYEQGDLVVYEGLKIYECIQDPCEPGRVPHEHPDTWTPRAAFPDDLRTLDPVFKQFGLGDG